MRQTLLEEVKGNPEMTNLIEQLYRTDTGYPGTDGGTAQGLIYEAAHGLFRFSKAGDLEFEHLQKAQNSVRWIESLLKDGNLSPAMREIAETQLGDLKFALAVAETRIQAQLYLESLAGSVGEEGIDFTVGELESIAQTLFGDG